MPQFSHSERPPFVPFVEEFAAKLVGGLEHVFHYLYNIISFHLLGIIIIPTDYLIFFRGVGSYTTSIFLLIFHPGFPPMNKHINKPKEKMMDQQKNQYHPQWLLRNHWWKPHRSPLQRGKCLYRLQSDAASPGDFLGAQSWARGDRSSITLEAGQSGEPGKP